MGPEDYVNAPFNPSELVTRVRAQIRRASRIMPEDIYVFEDVIINFAKTESTRAGEKIIVTRKEFKTLEFLTKNAQRVILRDELLDKVWGGTRTPLAHEQLTTTCSDYDRNRE